MQPVDQPYSIKNEILARHELDQYGEEMEIKMLKNISGMCRVVKCEKLRYIGKV